MLFSRLTC